MNDQELERNASNLINSLFGVHRPQKLDRTLELGGITEIRVAFANTDWVECPGAKLVRLEPKKEDASILGFESPFKLMTILNILLKKVMVFEQPRKFHLIGHDTCTIVSVCYEGPQMEVA